MTRSRASSTARTLLAGLLAAAPALATTWVVDDNGGPGVDFVNIQAAVDAAVDGDVIEVRDGAYPGFTIDGKALVVIGLGSSVRISAVVLVTNISASRQVEFDRLDLRGLLGSHETLVLMQNAGSVRLIDCTVFGLSEVWYSSCSTGDPPELAVSAALSEDVTLLRCTVRGGDAYYAGYNCAWQGGCGIVAAQSTFTVLDTSISGGLGGNQVTHGGNGGDGAIFSLGSTVFAHRSIFVGGNGGFGYPCHSSCSGVYCGFYGQYACPSGATGRGVLLQTGSAMTRKDTTVTSIVPPDAAQEVAIAPFCIGTYEECPCGNSGAGTAGCEHSFGLGGARLEGVGNASVAADTVTLQVTGLGPNGAPTALFFQGTTGSEGTPFNDGLLCAGGTIRRMKGKAASNGMVSFGFGQPGDAAVSVAGAVPPAGATRFYQVWYRNNNASFCTPLRFNMSNGVEIAWAP